MSGPAAGTSVCATAKAAAKLDAEVKQLRRGLRKALGQASSRITMLLSGKVPDAADTAVAKPAADSSRPDGGDEVGRIVKVVLHAGHRPRRTQIESCCSS